MIDLTRKIPKLNTMYPITKADSVDTINCRINFNIIDFIYSTQTSHLNKCLCTLKIQ